MIRPAPAGSSTSIPALRFDRQFGHHPALNVQHPGIEGGGGGCGIGDVGQQPLRTGR